MLKILIVFAACALIAAIFFVQRRLRPHDISFEWRASPSAPAEFPVYLISGFTFLNGRSLDGIPDDRFVATGWGEADTVHLIGRDQKPLPDEAHLQYYSLIDRKFFEARFALPAETLQRHFAEGWIDTQERRNDFDFLIFGLGPEGHISVWIQGARNRILIGEYRAQEYAGQISELIKDPQLSTEEFLRIPFTNRPQDQAAFLDPAAARHWPERKRRFDWKLSVDFGEIHSAEISAADGEQTARIYRKDEIWTTAVPNTITLSMIENGKKMALEANCPVDKLLPLFAATDGPSELRISRAGGAISLALLQPSGETPLTPCKARYWEHL